MKGNGNERGENPPNKKERKKKKKKKQKEKWKKTIPPLKANGLSWLGDHSLSNFLFVFFFFPHLSLPLIKHISGVSSLTICCMKWGNFQ